VLREDAVRDIGSLLVWIGVQPQFDRDRVAVMGGSYGGYMALASLVAYGERLRGGVDLVGSATSSRSCTTPQPTGAICGAPNTATSATPACGCSSIASPR